MNGPRLPVTWPLAVLFVAFPLWWLLGVSSFIWPVVAIPMLVILLRWRRVNAPVPIILWFAFLSWVLLSGLQLDGGGSKVATFAYRLSLYAAASVLFLYVYNMPRSGRTDTKVLRILTVFWIVVVAGGYAGIVLRSATFNPPIEHLIPPSLMQKPFMQELVQPVFAEITNFLGYPLARPAAPFTYTNEWGGNIAALTPVAFAAATAAGRGLRRRIIIVVLVASLVPMVISLNRGMFLSLAIGIVYVIVRLAMRGRVGALASLLALTGVAVAVVALTPLGHLVFASFDSTHGNSNATRLSLYQQVTAAVSQSPWFGFGAPKPVTTGVGQVPGTPAIGTQGQLWMVLYSSGYPAAVLFIGFYLAVLWQTRHARGMVGLWLHTVPLVALAQIAVYGWLSAEVQVVMVTCALAYRSCWRPVPALARSGSEDPAVPSPDVPGGSGVSKRGSGVVAVR
ncbi:MAG: O-antigen ligase family protein [Streptosporangiaceae bacterium]|jgi:hypothetical protein